MAQPTPTWIVTNREDGQNVNNWHWVEKDCLGWVKNHAKESLSGKEIAPGVTVEKGDNSVEVTGEATANNRRGKTIYLYELEFTVKWVATAADEKDTVRGTVTFPYIGEDNEGEQWEAKVKGTPSSAPKQRQEETTSTVFSKGVPTLRALIADCIAHMKAHFRVDPSHSLSSSASSSASTCSRASQPATSPSPSTSPSPQAQVQATAPHLPHPQGALVSMTERFSSTSPKALYDLLMDPQRMSMVTGGAKIDRTIGGEFTLFNGAVTGTFVELVQDTRIVERWRFSSWPAGHFSVVTINIAQKGGDTTVDLSQVGVPREDVERTEQGWRENVWNRIRGMFGFGGPSL